MRLSRHQPSSRLPRDIEEFLAEYPDYRPLRGADEEEEQSANLRFYRNQEPCQPDELLINDLHREWWGDVEQLEYNHGYIQWLFPIREYGMNFSAQPLHLHEIKAMREEPVVMERVLRSYRMMLDFYGMQLLDERTGLICRSDRYERRYRNLTRSPHNNLRISRIMKCLSELGLEKLNAGFLLHVLVEQATHRQLITSTIISSMDRWWANCIRNQEEREWIGELIRRVRKGQLGFERDDYERVMKVRERLGRFQWKLDLEEDVEEVRLDMDGNAQIRRESRPVAGEEQAPRETDNEKEEERAGPTNPEKSTADEEQKDGPGPSTNIPEITTEDIDARLADSHLSDSYSKSAKDEEPKGSVLDENMSDDDGFVDDDPWEGIQDEEFVEVDRDVDRSPSPLVVDMESSSGSLSKVKGWGKLETDAKTSDVPSDPTPEAATPSLPLAGSSAVSKKALEGLPDAKPVETKPSEKRPEPRTESSPQPKPKKKVTPTPEPRLMFDW